MTQTVDKVQVYDNEYGGRCDTFGCDGNPIVNVGRPDAIHLSTKFCVKCAGELVTSVNERYPAVVASSESTLDSDLVGFLVENGIKSRDDFEVVLSASVKTNSEITSTEEAMEALMMEPKEDNDTVTLLLTEQEEAEGVDLDEVLEAARTHAEVDSIVSQFDFKNIPTKSDGATLAERKAAIEAEFDSLEAE
jgi:hypothetical protein